MCRIFAHVKMQALVQVQRHTVFSIFDSLVAMQRDGKICVSRIIRLY